METHIDVLERASIELDGIFVTIGLCGMLKMNN